MMMWDGVAVELDDTPWLLAFKAADAGRCHLVVEATSFAHHGLALDDAAHPVFWAIPRDDGVGLAGVSGPSAPGCRCVIQLASSCSVLVRQARDSAGEFAAASRTGPPLLPVVGEGIPALGARAGNPWRREKFGAAWVGQGRLGLGMEAAANTWRDQTWAFCRNRQTASRYELFGHRRAAVGEQEARQVVVAGKILP